MDKDYKPQSFDLKSSVHLVTDISRIRKTVHNMMAALPGTDSQLRNEWVVVGAHYDHLGLGDENSLAPSQIGQIHHGADDNASGTAGVLEFARLAPCTTGIQTFHSVHDVRRRRRRTAWIQLLREPPHDPPSSIVGMINMDMIGRVTNNHVNVLGVGTSPEFKSWIEEFDKTVGLQINFSASGHEGSDHISFDGKHIPILFFFSGLHSDYHRPSDTADKINSEGAVSVLELVAMSAERLANAATRPQYTAVPDERPANAGIVAVLKWIRTILRIRSGFP